MLEFRKYPAPPPVEKDPPMCSVTYPEACDRPAVGEVWALPFCQEHGEEAVTAARLEAFEDAGRDLDALVGRRFDEVPNRNPILQRALESIVLEDGSPSPDHGAAIRSAYALREEDTDPDTLAYDYEDAIECDTPYDWWCESREMIVGFMREAFEANQPHLVAALEPIREHATVQQELAFDDMDRRYVQPRRAAREERKRRDAERDPSAEILHAVNGELGGAIDRLEALPAEGAHDREAVRRVHQAIAEAGQLVCREERRVSGEARPA